MPDSGNQKTAEKLCLILLFLIAGIGCGGSNSSTDNSSASSNSPGLSGNWQMKLQHNSLLETQSGFLLQSGNTLSGNLLSSGETVAGQIVCPGVGSVQGQANDNTVAITIIETAQTVNLTGTASSDLSSMSGSYSVFASGCGRTETGNWTATRVPPVTGSFSVMFTSTQSNINFSANGSITQGTNKGNSYAFVTGSMTSTNAPCFTSASFTGQISGTAVLLNISNSTGPLGTYSGTAATDASGITGTYIFSNPQSQAGCNDGGNAAFTLNPSSG